MPRAQQELRRAVPDRYDNHVARVQRHERVRINARKTKIANLDDTTPRDENIGRLEVTMHHAIRVQVGDPVEQLPHERLDHGAADRRAHDRQIVVDDLQKVVVDKLVHEKDGIVLQQDLP